MFKIKDRVVMKVYKSYLLGFASGEIARIARQSEKLLHPTMYKIEIDNHINNNHHEWAFEKELSHIVTICA